MAVNEFAHACRNVIANQTICSALDDVEANAVNRILSAKTPEDREGRFQEYAAVKRLRVYLTSKANEATKD